MIPVGMEPAGMILPNIASTVSLWFRSEGGQLRARDRDAAGPDRQHADRQQHPEPRPERQVNTSILLYCEKKSVFVFIHLLMKSIHFKMPRE